MRTKFVSSDTPDEPVSLVEARQHLRDPEVTEDSEIEFLLKSAREQAEQKTGRILLPQTWDIFFDTFPSSGCYGTVGGYWFELPYAPLISITSITYIDGAGATQSMTSTDYTADTTGLLPRVRLAYGKSWPSALYVANAVTIRAKFGYASPNKVPESIKHWMKLFIEEADKNRGLSREREAFSSHFADGLLDRYRIVHV